MTTKAEYALLWANGKTFSEIYDLMEAEIRGGSLDNWDGTAKRVGLALDAIQATRPHDFMPGDGAYYDELRVTIVERMASTRPGSDDYRVRSESGEEYVFWGSDLVRIT